MSVMLSKKAPTAEITTINTNTRVDYVLKFNQQPAVVLAESGDSYESVKSEYLANLAEQVNAAYISASLKLTNIQIRCRLIEQLYHGVLFDPEQPLPLTLGRLLDDKSSIALIFDQGQYLSEQILIELCQLASLAKKRDIKLSIVIFTNHQIVPLLFRDKALFDKRLTIINAESGLIMPFGSKQLKRYQQTDKGVWFKFTFVIIGLVIIAALIGYFSYFENSNITTRKKEHKPAKMVLEQPVSNDKNNRAETKKQSKAIVVDKQQLASSNEIYAALSPVEQASTIDTQKLASTHKDHKGLERLNPSDNPVAIKPTVSSTEKLKAVAELAETEIITTQTTELLPWQADVGFVIQLAGFSEKNKIQTLLEQQPLANSFYYQKQVNNKPYWVLISRVYVTKFEAKQAIAQLPKGYQQQGPWIKSVAAIKQERISEAGE